MSSLEGNPSEKMYSSLLPKNVRVAQCSQIAAK